MRTEKATARDVNDVADLFDQYRQHFGAQSDIDAARAFIAGRISSSDGAVFVARDDAGAAVGFAQLYPKHSSISLSLSYVLNDLFVAPAARKAGAGRELLDAAERFAVEHGATKMSLSTNVQNTSAHALYEGAGWEVDTQFVTFKKALLPAAAFKRKF